MNIEDTINDIIEMLDLTGRNTEAQSFGINLIEDKPSITPITSNPDVYMLVDSLKMDKRLSNSQFEYFCLLTTGWAAPLSKDGQVQGMPSMHPERRRVSLLVTININNSKEIVSAIKFADNDEVVFDYGKATGSLADAVNSLFE